MAKATGSIWSNHESGGFCTGGKGPPGKPTAQMNLGAGLAQPRVQSITLAFCSGILQFHSDWFNLKKFEPRTEVQSCFPYDSVGLRVSRFRCCKSGRKAEQYPSTSKSPWPNHIMMYTVHAHHIFDSVLYKSDNVIFQYQNIDMRIYQIWYFSK